MDGVPLPAFVPGQFLTFALPTAAGRTLTRCYSLSDGPNASSYRITVKRVLAPAGRPELPPGACSSYLHDRLQVGDVVNVKAPAGHFVVDPEPSVPTVLIAGGVGITPLLSMLRGGLAAEPNRPVHLYYGVRHGAEHGFKEELAELARQHPTLHLNVVYSQPGPDDASGRDLLHTGRIDVDILRRTLPAGRHRFYVCGPPGMMASLIPALRQWGVPPDDIHHEAFGPASARSAVMMPTSQRTARDPQQVAVRHDANQPLRVVALDDRDVPEPRDLHLEVRELQGLVLGEGEEQGAHQVFDGGRVLTHRRVALDRGRNRHYR